MRHPIFGNNVGKPLAYIYIYTTKTEEAWIFLASILQLYLNCVNKNAKIVSKCHYSALKEHLKFHENGGFNEVFKFNVITQTTTEHILDLETKWIRKMRSKNLV